MTQTAWQSLIQDSLTLGLGTWSFSKLKTFENCPMLFQHTYLSKTPGKKTHRFDAVPAKVGIFIHAVFEACMLNPTQRFGTIWMQQVKLLNLVHDELTLAQELKYPTLHLVERLHKAVQAWSLAVYTEQKLTPPGTPLLAYVDFIGISRDQKTGVLIDFKTHGETKTNAQKVKDQLSFYTMCLFLSNPQIHEIKPGCIYVPEEKVKFRNVVHRCSLPKIEKMWLARFQAAATYLQAKLGQEFPPVKGPTCKWCSVPCRFAPNEK